MKRGGGGDEERRTWHTMEEGRQKQKAHRNLARMPLWCGIVIRTLFFFVVVGEEPCEMEIVWGCQFHDL